MDIKTFRAKTMQDALALVRRELGPDASVLHTRELNSSLVRRMLFGRKYEVAASSTVNVPSRLPTRMQRQEQGAGSREPGVSESQYEVSSLHAPSAMLDLHVAG